MPLWPDWPESCIKMLRLVRYMRESDLQKCVLGLAHLLGWRVAHFRPAQTKKGWRTPVEADGAGFPDLVLTKEDRILFRELKSKNGQLSDAQVKWQLALHNAGMDSCVWRPKDWLEGTIEKELRG